LLSANVGHSGGSRAALAVAGGCRKREIILRWGFGGFYLAVCPLTID